MSREAFGDPPEGQEPPQTCPVCGEDADVRRAFGTKAGTLYAQAAEELERWRWLKEDATAEQWERVRSLWANVEVTGPPQAGPVQ